MSKPCIQHLQKNQDGYGRTTVNGRRIGLHVLAWEEANGQQRPDNYEIHHECGNRRCLEPTHLVAIADHEHRILHGFPGRKGIAPDATHCINGHEWTPENTYARRGARECRECRRVSRRRWEAKHRIAARSPSRTEREEG